MSTPVKNFSGLEFDLAIGQVYGVRAWSVDKHGRLRAKRYPGAAPWRPGVNVADCRASESGWYSQGGWVLSTFFTAPVGTPPPIAEPDKPKEKHSAPDESCGCGFYAYTGDDHPEVKDREDHDVIGVVRGTGRTLIGTKGFRCEKAEIVALLDPTRGGLRLAKWRRQQRRNLTRLYPKVPLLVSERQLWRTFPIEATEMDPGSDEFWSLP